MRQKKEKKENLSNNVEAEENRAGKCNFLSVKFKPDLLNPKKDKP